MRSIYRLAYIAILLSAIRRMAHKIGVSSEPPAISRYPLRHMSGRLPDAIMVDSDRITDVSMVVTGAYYGDDYFDLSGEWGGWISKYDRTAVAYVNKKNGQAIHRSTVLVPVDGRIPGAAKVCRDVMAWIRRR